MPDTPIPWVGLAALVAIFLLPFVSGHVKLPVGGQLGQWADSWVLADGHQNSRWVAARSPGGCVGVGSNAAALRWGWLVVPAEKPLTPEGPLAKSDKEIMEILEAFDLTRCAWSAAQLVGCDPRPSPPMLPAATPASPHSAGSAVGGWSIRSWPRSRSWWTTPKPRFAPMWSTSAWWRWGSVGWSGRDRRSTPPASLVPWLASLAGQDLGGQE